MGQSCPVSDQHQPADVVSEPLVVQNQLANRLRQLFALPLSLVFGFMLNWGAPGVWAGFGGGLVMACVLLLRRLWHVTDATTA